MSTKLLFIITIFVSLSSIGQGEKVGGLKAGFWEEKFNDGERNYVKKGKYKIVPLSQYDTVSKLVEGCYRIKYFGHVQNLLFSEQKGAKVSVKDSVWNSYDDNGNLVDVTDWVEGLSKSSKVYDEAGMLLEHTYNDYESDSAFKLTYIDGQLFKRTVYLPNNKNQEIKVYYPNNFLAISNAELDFKVNFLSKPSDSQDITLTAKKEITVKSIASKSRFVKIINSNKKRVTFPFTVRANTSVHLKVIVSPSPTNCQIVDTLSLFTLDRETPYQIYSNIYASHIDDNNVSTLKSIKLSKTRDKYLILSSMGTITGATILSRKESFDYAINGITKIDLSIFDPGYYRLMVSSCNTGGNLSLVIAE